MALVAEYDLAFDLKPVYPLAISDPTFFQRIDPLFPRYLFRDTARLAERLNIPYRWPRPDPVVQDMDKNVTSTEQP
ncbi:MAG: 2-hydroxychromene-2-carboxylate isomerase [Gammaproteobacteria bacterium]|jgi:2-hydroxychromene-2-carboxylate isomerase